MAEQQPFADVKLASNPEPRCPCVLLVDTSGSMSEIVSNAGQDTGQTTQVDGKTYRVVTGGVTKLDLVNEGLRTYAADVTQDPLAAQRVEVSVITFGGSVQTVSPFVTASEFTPPTLTANGETPMGAAILQAIEAVAERKRLYKQNGLHYYRPWIFLMTDGAPVETPPDLWKTAAAKVREGEAAKAFAFFAIGVGLDGADFDILRQISVRQPLALKGYSFREMFLWLSQSQRSVSHSNPGQEDQVKLNSPSGWASL